MNKRLYHRILSVLLCAALLLAVMPVSPRAEASSDADLILSTEWTDYIGDVETFTYGVLADRIRTGYDVFPAYVKLSNGISISGIGYTNYADCYASEDESSVCFAAGFIPSFGEFSIPDEEFDSGLMIHNLEYEDESTSFIMAYRPDSFRDHYVANNKYVIFGVNDEGNAFYEVLACDRKNYDESIGSLYSYDRSRFLLDVDVGNFTGVTGSSLSQYIDYRVLEAEINEIIETQNVNFYESTVTTNLHFAQEAIVAYLLSLQEESFLGYNVAALVEAAQALDPLECYRLTSEGLITLKLDHQGDATAAAKVLVGTVCVLAAAVGMAGSIIAIECPPLSALAGSIVGASIDVFSQVVFSGEALNDVDWRHTLVAAAAGAVSGFIGPYISVTYTGTTAFIADSLLDGVVGGIEHAALAWMDGEDGMAVLKSFGAGVGLGFAISAGFKAAVAAVVPAVKKIGEFGTRIMPKLSSKVSNFTKGVSSFFAPVGEAITELKRLADSTPFHSKYISEKTVKRHLSLISGDDKEELLEESFKDIKKDDILDIQGNPISKDQLRALYDSAAEGETIGYFKRGNDTADIVKQNGIVSISYDHTQYQTVRLPNRLTSSRTDNFDEASAILLDSWNKGTAKAPSELLDAIQASGKTLEGMAPGDLTYILQQSKNGWVLHENADLWTLSLIPRSIHDNKTEMGIAHMGGVAVATFLEKRIGLLYFDQLVSSAATAAVIGVEE